MNINCIDYIGNTVLRLKLKPELLLASGDFNQRGWELKPSISVNLKRQ